MHRKTKVFATLLILAGLIFLLNIQVTYREGIDFDLYKRKIPVYIKIISFIERDYYYRTLAREIAKSCGNDIEKIKSIFNWTCENIYSGIPEPLHVKDDHILNIIIRGYGSCDQSADVFTTLCTYAGFPAAMYAISPKGKEERYIVSVVYYSGRFILFDTYYKNIFINNNGEIASIRDVIEDPLIVKSAKNRPLIKGIPYADYFNNLRPIDKIDKTLRAELQMPTRRLWYELKRRLRFKDKAELFYGEGIKK